MTVHLGERAAELPAFLSCEARALSDRSSARALDLRPGGAFAIGAPRAQLRRVEQQRVVRLLGAIVVLLAVLLVGTGAGLLVSLRAARAAERRQDAALAHLVETSTSARQALARFERERDAISGDPGGPLGRMDRQIQLMSIMVAEQMVLISEMAGLQEAAASALGAAPPERRAEPRARVRRER